MKKKRTQTRTLAAARKMLGPAAEAYFKDRFEMKKRLEKFIKDNRSLLDSMFQESKERS
jgi:hypothetical protein